MHSCCCCCLQCAPEKDLTMPYTHLGKTEIYSDMLKECFNIHLGMGAAGECGICAACVVRLRDASDFKLQVQRSQAELQARLQGALRVKVEPEMEDGEGTSEEVSGEERPVKLEMADEVDIYIEILPGETRVKTEMASEDDMDDQSLLEERAVRPEVSDDAASHEDCISPFRPTEEAYTCDTCGKHFTGKSSLIEHVRGHAAQAHAHTAACSCATCATHSSSTSLFAEHTRARKNEKTYLTHKGAPLTKRKKTTGKSPYTCEICSRQFTQKCILDKHRRIHTGEKPYSCEVCNRRFAQKSNLDVHKRLHTGDKPYRCDDCHRCFTQKGNLDIHMRVHTGDKPYKCEACSRQFTVLSSLIRHKKSCCTKI